MKEENKCELAGFEHAWRNKEEMWGFDMLHKNECANCGLTRTRHNTSEEWWSYSDGRPNEPIVNIIPV